MFAVLDTNHFAEMAHDSVRGAALQRRLSANEAQIFTTIVTAQEAFQGWFTFINRQPAGRDQMRGYAQFQHSIVLLMKLTLLPFDAEAANHFHRLQSGRVRIGTMD